MNTRTVNVRRARIGVRLLAGLALLALALTWFEAQPLAAARPTGSTDLAAPWARVGLQAGHWKIRELPAALARLRTNSGADAAGRAEWSLNLDIAQRTAALLRAQGVAVDVLPATVPTGYRADAFVALHADANSSARARGYKVATRWRSTTAWRDQILLEQVGSTYAAVTGLPKDPSVTRGMRGYYAFSTFLGTDYRVDKTTPAMIIEMGFMSNAADRAVLFDQPGRAASGIAQGLLAYLHNAHAADGVQAQAAAVAAAAATTRSVVVTSNGVRIRDQRDGKGTVVLVANRGDVFPYAEVVQKPPQNFTPGPYSTELATGGWSKIRVPNHAGDVYISRDYINIQQFGEPP
jgi:hypothetical protein